MPKVAYDIFTLPIAEKLTLFNANLLYDTSVSPIQLKGFFEPNFKLGLKYSMDGQIYLDEGLTLGLFNSAIPPHPTSGTYPFFVFTFTKQALVGVWLGKTTSNYDTPVLVAVNKQIGALLVYNASANSVQVIHQSTVYPNYETSGTYSDGIVTLAQDQYALFYGSTKPTVNTSAPWGFTDYEPKSSTTQPSTYILVTNGTSNFYYEQTLALSSILHIGKGAYVVDAYGAKVSSVAILEANMDTRGGYNADGVEYFYKAPLDGSPTPYMNQMLFPIYDSDPIANMSWNEGWTYDNLSYVRDSGGVAYVARLVKSTVEPYNPRYTFIFAQRFQQQDAQTVKVRVLALFKALVDVTSYGSVNQVINPGFALYRYTNPYTFKYFDGSDWVTATPGNNSYNYYNGYGIEASIFNPINTSEVYKARYVMRKQLKYGSPPIKVGAILHTATEFGTIGVFQDYNGGTIPTGNYVGFVVDGLIRLDNTAPTISTETPPNDTATWSYLYGYPYSISVSAPSSAQPGQQVTVTVTTDAPNGKHVYVVDKDTDAVLGSGTVSGGSASVSFQMPNKNLSIRVYVEGADIALA
jgi:hypothetical protein